MSEINSKRMKAGGGGVCGHWREENRGTKPEVTGRDIRQFDDYSTDTRRLAGTEGRQNTSDLESLA